MQAMSSAGLGHLIEIERSLQRCLKTTNRNAQAKCIVDRLLVYRAEQERNRVAGVSLETFFNLAEVEAQKELLNRTSIETDRLAKAAAGVKDSGINGQIDRLGIELQEIELKRRFSELQKNESSLQFNLRRLIGDDPSEPTQIVPLVDLEVSPDPGDRAAAVETAFACRAELKAQEFLLSFDDDAALDSTRQQLRTTDASLGTKMPGCGLKLLAILFHGNESQVELCYRVRQLRQLRYETMRLIEVEVSAAYFAVCNRLQRLSLAKAEAERRHEYVGRLEAARDTVNYQYQDLADARIRLLTAEANLIHELYALRIDEAKLIAAQGLYAE
jgi:hypothetical protein